MSKNTAAEHPALDSPALRRRLERFSSSDAEFLCAWLQDNPVGANLALQILEDLEDLLKKEEQPVGEILSTELGRISGEELPLKEVARQLRDALQARLHPHRQAHEAAYAALVRRLDLPAGTSLKAPQNFEGKTFSLQIEFLNLESLRQNLKNLQDALSNEVWNEIWDF